VRRESGTSDVADGWLARRVREPHVFGIRAELGGTSGKKSGPSGDISARLCAHHNGEKTMTKFRLLGAAALVVSLASPVMAQSTSAQSVSGQDAARAHAQKQMRMNSQATHRQHMAYRHNNMANDNMAYRDNNNGWNNGRRDSGFWPGDVAAGVVGGAVATADAAVNTAGAIATAPFRGDSYAYYNDGNNNGWNGYGWTGQSYAERNGFVCQPGTWFKGEDGRPHICQ
jgi:hypothetical protein